MNTSFRVLGSLLCFFAIASAYAFNPIFEKEGVAKPLNDIDKIVFANLEKKGMKPANLCSDAVFIRRVYLDIIGELPTPEEVKSFLSWDDSEKRNLIVKELLSRKEHAEYWGLKFGDALCIKAEFPINLWPNAAQSYQRLVNNTIYQNVPYDIFTRSLLTSTGSNFRDAEVNFYRAMQAKTPEGIAAAVARFYLSMDYSKLEAEKQKNLANFFSRISYKETKEWKEEIVFIDPKKRAPFDGIFLDGKTIHLDETADVRAAFADWLTAPGNKYFASTIVNRMWTWVFDTPLAGSADEMWDNPTEAESSELLNYLSKNFEKNGYNIRKFLEDIFTSYTYQQSSIPSCDNSDIVKNFGAYKVRQIEAEVLIDIICQVTGTSEIYFSATPEPYTTLPNYKRSVSLPDGSITSSFLELFGRSTRDTGMYSERVSLASPSQRLHLINSQQIRNKLESGPWLDNYRLGRPDDIQNLYLSFMSRYPTKAEMDTVMPHISKDKKNIKRQVIDIAWALINSEEFLNRH